MKHTVVIACLFLVACASPPHSQTVTHGHGVTDMQVNAKTMVVAHNRWRAAVGVKALHWSKQLEAVAADYADTLAGNGCRMQHSHNRYGENLYWASPVNWSDGHTEVQKVSEAEVVDAWGSEQKDYNYRNNSCSGTCGHYTQIVWRDTTEVGCAARVCPDGSQSWVCNYNPPGNYRGVRPY